MLCYTILEAFGPDKVAFEGFALYLYSAIDLSCHFKDRSDRFLPCQLRADGDSSCAYRSFRGSFDLFCY